MSETTTLLLLGGSVGFAAALIGAFVDWRIARRRSASGQRLPGCIFLVTGGLGFAGLVVVAVSLLLDDGLRRPLITGAGVMAGFLLGFALMLTIWLLQNRRRRSLD